MNPRNEYQSPLSSKYASYDMKHIFSDNNRYATWRELWIVLAKAEQALGLNITDAQILEMLNCSHCVNYDRVAVLEDETKHDVMAHLRSFGEQCPNAKPIIHLGATSCYITDNADIIIMQQALKSIRRELTSVIRELTRFAHRYKDLPILSYTHMQVAQPTTLGKRATLWLQDLMMDLEQIDYQLDNIKMLGCRGATGTSASFLELFDGDEYKVKNLETLICNKFDMDVFDVSGQTYTRKQDFNILSVLSGIAQSASKFSNDIRFLSHLEEVSEDFGDTQVGSSAMPYKQNPIKCERIGALSRYVICDLQNPAITSATQWMERTLDDSANRRISIPEAFLATDAILQLYMDVISHLRVNETVIWKHLYGEIPYLITEGILMQCVKKGGDRQSLHEKIRVYSMESRKYETDLISKIVNDDSFDITSMEIDTLMDINKLVGMAPKQADDYVKYVSLKLGITI